MNYHFEILPIHSFGLMALPVSFLVPGISLLTDATAALDDRWSINCCKVEFSGRIFFYPNASLVTCERKGDGEIESSEETLINWTKKVLPSGKNVESCAMILLKAFLGLIPLWSLEPYPFLANWRVGSSEKHKI